MSLPAECGRQYRSVMETAAMAVTAGLIILVAGADRFVAGAAALAKCLGVPTLLVGMLVIGFGTSAPEMLVSATAAARGAPGIALGNAFGSNIGNILLILGVCALIRPLRATGPVVRRELPLLLGVTAVAALLIVDGTVSRLDAAILLAVFAASVGISIRKALCGTDGGAEEQPVADKQESAMPGKHPLAWAVIWVAVGLVMMLAASELLVWGAVEIAHYFGISDLIVGLTVVAVGTSLPELASSVVATRKGEDDLAIGNIIGSNIFNSMVVVGIAGLIAPIPAERAFIVRDIPVAFAATLLLYAVSRGRAGPGIITRREGALMLTLYAAYVSWLVISGTSA